VSRISLSLSPSMTCRFVAGADSFWGKSRHGPVGIARVIHPIPEDIKESVKREEESRIKEQEDDSSESEDSDMQDNVDGQVLKEMDEYMKGAIIESDMDWDKMDDYMTGAIIESDSEDNGEI
jgi:hypothetical protein